MSQPSSDELREKAREFGEDWGMTSETVDSLTALLKATRRETLEEAARVLDAEILARERFEDYMSPIDELAKAIRALAEKGKQP